MRWTSSLEKIKAAYQSSPLTADAKGEYITWTPMHYVETRLDDQQLYAAWATHTLVKVDGALKIKLKRVDLVNCDAAFGNIQLFM